MARTKATQASADGSNAPAADPDTQELQVLASPEPLAPESSSVATPEGGDSGDLALDPSPAVAVAAISTNEASSSGSEAELAAALGSALPTESPVVSAAAAEAGHPPPAVGVDASDADADADAQPSATVNALTVSIFPLRSYMDAEELRRRGGPPYSVPRRHGEDLVQRMLASFEPLED